MTRIGRPTIITAMKLRPASGATALLCTAISWTLSAPAAPAERYEGLEKKAHELELKGRFLEAQRTFARALVAAAERAARLSRDAGRDPASAREAEFLWAWSEVLAENAYHLTHWTSRPGAILPAFESARRAADSATAREGRELGAWLTYRLLLMSRRVGDAKRVAAEARRLGF
ncbi:MAG: hypothetical protein ACYS9X_31835, partial [Planctomycetota bacterium]